MAEERTQPQRSLLVIPDDAVFGLESARLLLGLKKGALPREIRLGRLRCTKRLNRRWISGKWLKDWLFGDG